MAFTIFYDGLCPLCLKEMQHLRKRNTEGQLRFEDIYAEDFSNRYPNLDWQALNDRIHGMYDDGRVIVGLDVTHTAWSLVGVGWLYAPLRWPVIKWFADRVYLVFAKHRYKISYWLTGQKRCESNCGIKY